MVLCNSTVVMKHEEELNKAAELWIAGVFLAYSAPDTIVKELREIAEKSFIAGANWAMEQGVTIDGCVTAITNERWLDIDDDKADEALANFQNDEQVIVQIRRKDE